MIFEWFSGSVLSKMAIALSVALLIALGALWTYHHVSVSLLKSELESRAKELGSTQAANASLRVQLVSLQGALTEQNKKVDDLVIAAAERSKDAEAALRRAAISAKKWKDEYDKVMNSPPVSEDDCKSTESRILQYYDLRSKEASQ